MGPHGAPNYVSSSGVVAIVVVVSTVAFVATTLYYSLLNRTIIRNKQLKIAFRASKEDLEVFYMP